ncbi:hypothetical protein JG688_00016836, partial [Phytophthora aleatoria]
PPRLPDLIVLDLAFFHSLQSLQYQAPTFDTNCQIAVVEAAFGNISYHTLKSFFLTLQKVKGTVTACKVVMTIVCLVWTCIVSTLACRQYHYQSRLMYFHHLNQSLSSSQICPRRKYQKGSDVACTTYFVLANAR